MCEGKIAACVVVNVSSTIVDDYRVDLLYTLSGVWNVELRVPGILGFYLISDKSVVVQKAHHEHTQHGSALFLNSPPSHRLSFASWKSEMIIPAVKCNRLSHKPALRV